MGNNTSGMEKPFWDFDENKNYVEYKLCGEKFKVLKRYPDSLRAAILLSNIKNFMIVLITSIGNKEPIPAKLVDRISVLLSTRFHVQEIQLDTPEEPVKFEGLNKPKNIISTNEVGVGPDGKLRAKNRLIFLKLRWNSGKLKNLDQLYNLIIHELTHTACNHVTYREAGNHAEDFKECEKYLREVKKKIKYR
jgi:hypothetical protein